jgi:hypothetical protein
MRTISERADGDRLRALIVPMWRAGLRVSEALDCTRATWIELGAGAGTEPAHLGADEFAAPSRTGYSITRWRPMRIGRLRAYRL